MSIKHRDYITPSSLGSYFGVGFNTPTEQIMIDLGLEESVFDDDAKERMRLGSTLEDSVLDFFEGVFDTIITDRNDELFTFYGDKIKGKIDGMATINGIETVVECKVSNAKSYKFTENMGYLFQVQSYMLATDTEQALLCGLYRGEPIFKIIPRDEDMINDIKELADFIYDVLVGFDEFDNFPIHLLDKYGSASLLEPITEVSDESLFTELCALKAEISALTKESKRLEKLVKEEYDLGIWNKDNYKLTIYEGTTKGQIDYNALSIDHPDLDLESYRKPNSKFRAIRTNIKKVK